jgi:hypothetical protein
MYTMGDFALLLEWRNFSKCQYWSRLLTENFYPFNARELSKESTKERFIILNNTNKMLNISNTAIYLRWYIVQAQLDCTDN